MATPQLRSSKMFSAGEVVTAEAQIVRGPIWAKANGLGARTALIRGTLVSHPERGRSWQVQWEDGTTSLVATRHLVRHLVAGGASPSAGDSYRSTERARRSFRVGRSPGAGSPVPGLVSPRYHLSPAEVEDMVADINNLLEIDDDNDDDDSSDHRLIDDDADADVSDENRVKPRAPGDEWDSPDGRFVAIEGSDDEDDTFDRVLIEDMVEVDDSPVSGPGLVVRHGLKWEPSRPGSMYRRQANQPAGPPAFLRWNRIQLSQFVGSYSDEDCDSRRQSPLFHFLLMFPVRLIPDILRETNSRLPLHYRNLTVGKLLKVFGLLISMTLGVMPTRKDYWRKGMSPYGTPLCDYGRFGMSSEEFERILEALAFGPTSQLDPWSDVRPLVDAFNQRRQDVIVPGDVLCVDESKSPWYLEESGEFVTVEPQRFVSRKPKKAGYSLRSCACGNSGVMLQLEIREGKQAMQRKKYFSEVKHGGTAATLRLVEPFQDSARTRTVVAGSAFASVNTAYHLRQHNFSFVGSVRTAISYFPLRFLRQQQLQRGESMSLETVFNGVPMTAIAWQNRKLVTMLATTGETTTGVIGKSYRRMHDRLQDVLTVQSKPVIGTAAAKIFRDNANQVDNHNQVREGTLQLEVVWRAKNWANRFSATILGMITVDAYLAYWLENKNVRAERIPLQTFVEAMCSELVSNTADKRRREPNSLKPE